MMHLPLLCFLALTLLAQAETERPNIIFLLTDDQRRDSLPCYGNTFVSTPHIDRLAKEGLVFDKASVTSAICTPSRASYLLGQYERRHAVNFNSGYAVSESAWELSYPLVLRRNGYFTGYIGKNHVEIGAQGYQSGIMEKSFDFFYAGHGHIYFYPKEKHDIFRAAAQDTQLEILDESATSFFGGGSFIEGAVSFLDKRDTQKPFALSICLNLPHGAGTGTMEMRTTDDPLYVTTYRNQINEIPLPLTYRRRSLAPPKLPVDLLRTEHRQNIYDYADYPDTLREKILRQYQTITGIDRLVGSIRQQLRAHGLADNTVIIYSSDHGLLLGEHGLGGKALNYETCLGVPLIIYDPRSSKNGGKRTNALALSIDIAPTILELGGATIPPTVQGTSLVPLLSDPELKIRNYAFAENLWSTIFGNPRIESIRDQRYKYIRYFTNDDSPWVERRHEKKFYGVSRTQRDLYTKWRTATIKGERPIYEELYDLATDPGETANLVAEPSQQQRLEHMRQSCDAAVKEAYEGAADRSNITPLEVRYND